MNTTPTSAPSLASNLEEFRLDAEKSWIWNYAWDIRPRFLPSNLSQFAATETDFGLNLLSPNTMRIAPEIPVCIERMRDARSVKLFPALGPEGVCLVARYDENIDVFSSCIGFPTAEQAEQGARFLYETIICDHGSTAKRLSSFTVHNYWPMSVADQVGWITNPTIPGFGELQFVKPIITFSDLTQFKQGLGDFVSASGLGISDFPPCGVPVNIGEGIKCRQRYPDEWKLFFERQRGLSEVTIMTNTVLISGPSTGSYVSWRRPFEGEKDRGFKFLREQPSRLVDPLLEQHYVFGGNIVYAEKNPRTGEYMPYVFCINPITGFAMLGELKKGEDMRSLLDRY